MRLPLTIAAVLIALTTSALADHYWVVQNITTYKCSIIEQESKPSEQDIIVVGSMYPDRSIAERAMTKTISKCRTDR